MAVWATSPAAFANLGSDEGSPQDTNKLAEIIVTAQKREQSIEDVGIAITAFTGEQIREYGFQDSFDIARMTPGVHISGNNGGQKTLFSIRGVTQNDFNDQTESPVAVYVDDGYVAFGQGQTFGMFDLARVEVLKGPQGTLFGRNATGGLVHFVTNQPTQELGGFADVTYGSYNQIRFEGAVGGPIAPGLSVRTAVLFDRFDPIIKNTYPQNFATLTGVPSPIGGQDTFNDNTLALRTHILFEPRDDFSVLASGNYARARLSTAPLLEQPAIPVYDAAGNHVNTLVAGPNSTQQAELTDGTPIHAPFGAPGVLRPPGGNLYAGSCTPQNYKDLACSEDFAFTHMDTTNSWGTSIEFKWKPSAFTLTALSDYKYFDKFQALPADGGAETTVNVMFASAAEQFSQEIRLNGETERTRWVSGLYYLHVNLNAKVALPADTDSLFLPLVGVPWEDTAISHQDTKSSSIFGQLEYDLSKKFTLIGGLRLIDERKNFTGLESFFLNSNPFTIDTATTLFTVQPKRSYDQSETLWSGKLQLDWHAADGLLVYAGVNRGVKAGGFNATTTFGGGFPTSEVPYGPEELLSYESGFKWDDLFGGTTRINGTAYYYDYKGYQGFFFTTITGYVQNVDAKYKGFELEVLSAPIAGLTVGLNTAFLDAKIYGVQLGPGVYRDSEPAFAPTRKSTALVRKNWNNALFGGSLVGQLDYSYTSAFYSDIRNYDASLMPAYGLADARLEWHSSDGHWQLAAFVNNFTDKRYFTIGYDLAGVTGSDSLVPGKPRWFGVSAHYNVGR